MELKDDVFFCAPPRTLMGIGVRRRLAPLMAHLGYHKGVLVTDTFFSQQSPWVKEYIELASAAGIETIVYDKGHADPTTTLCDEATQELMPQIDGVDHIVALGGGSNIDLAKALCVTLKSGKSVRDFVKEATRPFDALDLIAIPTTAGTGSEATPGAILVDTENATKVAVMDNALRPKIAVVDAEYTFNCPKRVTGDAGIDALTHAIESYVTEDSFTFGRGTDPDPGYSGRHHLSKVFARESIALCGQYLEAVYTDGSNKEARQGMAYASYYAALSYGSSGLNAGHGTAYAVAGLTHESHGSTNAVMLPYVLDALVETRAPELAEAATLLGVEGTQEEKVRGLSKRVRDIVEHLDIPSNLADFGVREDQLDTLLKDAIEVKRLFDAFPVNNRHEAYKQIIHNAYHGRLISDPN